MANVILNKTPDSPDTGNAQVDGTTVHTNTLAERKAALLAEMERLNEIERKSVPGARPRTPRAQMLDASEQEAKDPDHHYRFVNIRDTQKAGSRIEDGYKKVPVEEGGRNLGDEFALMRIPKAKYVERQQEIAAANKVRETAHIREMENAAESVARALRDNHGVTVSPDYILKGVLSR